MAAECRFSAFLAWAAADFVSSNSFPVALREYALLPLAWPWKAVSRFGTLSGVMENGNRRLYRLAQRDSGIPADRFSQRAA
jgi:hypothetical protein